MDVNQTPLRVLSGLALRTVLLDSVNPAFEAEYGVHIDAVFDPTTILMEHIRAGEHADVLIGTESGVAALATEGVLDGSTTTAVATSSIGYAVPPSHTPQLFEDADQFLDFALAARSVAYTRTGASGIHFSSVLERYGVAADLNARATVLDSGFTAEALLDGRADLAIQQLSELAAVPGIRIVGPLPEELQSYARFAAAASTEPHGLATRFLAALCGPDARRAYEAIGLHLPAAESDPRPS
ncbi:substrate-binding domain-containing protein [Actinopolymorpha alba]|uniref:substrate-binding domain-containing protein n=1 Tax=Actinopolymorpha alba TaxID=533267 RepID=UPI00036F5D8E|nr:substrate-binding domain-containing protein [Actinopolymorpha alba]